MPRIYNALNEPLDYCTPCYPDAQTEAQANGLDTGADHPDYEGENPSTRCEGCGEALTQKDN